MLHGMWQRFSSDAQLPRAPAEEFLWLLCTRSFVEPDGLQQEMDTWEGGSSHEPACSHSMGQGGGRPKCPACPCPEAGDDHKCDCSCIYLGPPIHKTRVIVPVLVGAGFLSGGTKGEVGAMVPKTLASLPNDPEVPPQGSDILPAVV